MSEQMELRVENVGAYLGEHKFTFKKGVNLVKAPNATGKTSLVRALELLVLPRGELKGKGAYMNFYAGAEEEATVEMKDGKRHVARKFRRVENDLFDTDGEPLFVDGGNIVKASFALPENVVINELISGGSIEKYIREFSGIKYYEQAIKELESIKNGYERELARFDDDRMRLEDSKERLEKERSKLDEIEKNYRNIPEIPINKLSQDEETRGALREIEKKRGQTEGERRSLIYNIEALKQEISRLSKEITDSDRKLKDIGKSREELKREIEKKDKERIAVHKKIDEIYSIIIGLEKDFQLTKDNIESIRLEETLIGDNKKVTCHACGKPLSFRELKNREEKLLKAIQTYKKTKRELEREADALKDDIDMIKKEITDLNRIKAELHEKQRSLANKESMLKDKKRRLADIEKDLVKLEEDVKKLSGTIDESLLKQKQEKDRLRGMIDITRSNIDRLEMEIKTIEETLKTAGKIGEKYKVAKEIERYLEIRKNKLVENVIEKFEARSIEIYNALGFSDFKDIRIDSTNFTVHIRREGYADEWDLNALSTSERITLGVVFLISAKEEYFSDFPFFVLDEVVTSYDPERFEKLIDYIKETTNYVIVTKLADTRETGRKVIIELVSS